jgi:hypothetical protein
MIISTSPTKATPPMRCPAAKRGGRGEGGAWANRDPSSDRAAGERGSRRRTTGSSAAAFCLAERPVSRRQSRWSRAHPRRMVGKHKAKPNPSVTTIGSRPRMARVIGYFATRLPNRAGAGGCTAWAKHELRRSSGHNALFLSARRLFARRTVRKRCHARQPNAIAVRAIGLPSVPIPATAPARPTPAPMKQPTEVQKANAVARFGAKQLRQPQAEIAAPRLLAGRLIWLARRGALHAWCQWLSRNRWGDQAEKAANWDDIFGAEAQKPHFRLYVSSQERKRETS